MFHPLRAGVSAAIGLAVAAAGCRSTGESAIAKPTTDVPRTTPADASNSHAEAGAPAPPPVRPSPFAVVATVGGFGRIHRLADGALLFASRGVFRRLTPSGGIERIGDLDIERRGLEMANNIDAILSVAGADPAPIFVSTNHGHFRSRYVSKTYGYQSGRFVESSGGQYDKIVHWKDDILLGHTLGVAYDASAFQAPDLPGSFVVVRGKKVPVPELPKDFIVTAWTAFPDGSVFALGDVKPSDSPLRVARTLLTWTPDAKKPTTIALPDLPADSFIDEVTGPRADDLWFSGKGGYLAHRDANGITKVATPCTEIVRPSAGDGPLYLVCGDAHRDFTDGSRLLVHKTAKLFVRTASSFEELPAPDFTLAAYADTLRSSFYTQAILQMFVDIEDDAFVSGPTDAAFIPYDVAARTPDDVWILAYDDGRDRTAILHRGPAVAVRSLDHEDAVRENEQPAAPATRACTTIFVSLGEPTGEALKKAEGVNDVPHRPFSARVHQTQHLGFVVSAAAPNAFTDAQAAAAGWAKQGFKPKLLCRTPVALSKPLASPP